MRELDPVHPPGQTDIGDHQHQRAREFVQHQFGGFGAFALDHVVIALLQQHANHFALHRVVLNDESGCANWH